MGGFKNEAIASEVEVGDRVPKPVPARNHVALQGDVSYGYAKRSDLRKARESVRDVIRHGEQAFIIGLLTGLFAGMIAMLIIRFSEVVG